MATVSANALKQRINRILAKDNQKFLASRSWQEKQNLGDFHIIDTWTNTVTAWFCNLEDTGRELGALRQHECLAANRSPQI